MNIPQTALTELAEKAYSIEAILASLLIDTPGTADVGMPRTTMRDLYATAAQIHFTARKWSNGEDPR